MYLLQVDSDMVFSLIVGAASLAATGATVGKAGCWATTGLGSAALGNSAIIAGHGSYWGLPAASAWSAASVGHGAFMPPIFHIRINTFDFRAAELLAANFSS
jgi:hypothetical protein